MKQLEIEFKTLLSEKDYLRLSAYFQLKPEHFHQQTNLYFDTIQADLRQKNCGLRIRRYEDRGEITLKTPAKVGLLETTDLLTLAETDFWVNQKRLPDTGNVASELQRLGIEPKNLLLLTELTTKRAEFTVPEGLLALDKSWYSGLSDYELELEVKDETFDKIAFDAFLKKLRLPYLPAENKIIRAVNAK